MKSQRKIIQPNYTQTVYTWGSQPVGHERSQINVDYYYVSRGTQTQTGWEPLACSNKKSMKLFK
jgi:hypothetical protein